MPNLTPECESILPLLSDLIDQEISSSERARVDAHLPHCESCTSYLEFLRTMESPVLRPVWVNPPSDMSASIAALTYARPTWLDRLRDMMRPLPARLGLAGGTLAAACALYMAMHLPGGEVKVPVAINPLSNPSPTVVQTPTPNGAISSTIKPPPGNNAGGAQSPNIQQPGQSGTGIASGIVSNANRTKLATRAEATRVGVGLKPHADNPGRPVSPPTSAPATPAPAQHLRDNATIAVRPHSALPSTDDTGNPSTVASTTMAAPSRGRESGGAVSESGASPTVGMQTASIQPRVAASTGRLAGGDFDEEPASSASPGKIRFSNPVGRTPLPDGAMLHASTVVAGRLTTILAAPVTN